MHAVLARLRLLAENVHVAQRPVGVGRIGIKILTELASPGRSDSRWAAGKELALVRAGLLAKSSNLGRWV
jgi:hypothetical protein